MDTTSELEELTHALACLARAAGARVDPGALRDAVLAAAVGRTAPDADEPESVEAPSAWAVRAARACELVGLQSAFVRAPLRVMLDAAGHGRPILLAARDGALVVVSGARGGRAQVERVGIEAETLGEAELVELVGPLDTVEFLTVDAHLATAGVASGAHAADGEHPSPRARLVRWMALEREDLLTVVVYAAFVGVLGLTVPVAVQSLVNTVAFGTLLQPLVVLSLMLFGGLAFSATLRGLQFWVVEIVQRRVFVRVVSDLAHRLPRVRREALDGRDGAELANRFFDVVTIQKSASSLLLDGLEIALTVSVGLIVLAFYHPLLLAFDVVLVLALMGVAWLGRRGPSTAIDESKQKYALAAWLEELARHDTAFKLGGGLDYAEARADALAHGWLDARRAHFRVVLRQVVVVLALQALASACVLGIGGWLVIDRQLTLGQLVAAEIIVTAVVTALAKVGKYFESYYDLLAAVDKIGHLLDLPLETGGGTSVASASPRGAAVAAESVVGGYAGGPTTLDGANFVLPAGARAALVGADGSGKSLLVEMLAALRAPVDGRIRIDGLDLRDAALAELRSRIAVVRGAAIVPDTVFENVRMGRPGIDTARVREALRAVGLEGTIDGLPDGLSTVLSASGEPLSRGARSRLAIARAIVSRPALLVLDDALDGVDPSVSGHLLDQLFTTSQPWTLIVASDDPDVARRCDHVLRLEGGLIATSVPSLPPPPTATTARSVR